MADSYSYPGGSFTLVDSAATRGILFNDVNPSCPSTPLAPAITNPTTKGVVTLTTNGGFTYVPNANVAPGEAAMEQAFEFGRASEADPDKHMPVTVPLQSRVTCRCKAVTASTS